VPDGVAYLAQTRHTGPARHGKTGPSPAHPSAPQSGLLPPLSGDHAHDKLAHKKTSLEPFSGRPRRHSSRVQLKPSIPSVCNKRFRTRSRSGEFRSQELEFTIHPGAPGGDRLRRQRISAPTITITPAPSAHAG
jgi:hypothetical protein